MPSILQGMSEFKSRRGRKEELVTLALRMGGTLALLCITALAVYATWGMYAKMQEASSGRDAAEAQLATVVEQESMVRSEIDQLSTARGVEAQMRKRFGVVRSGEGEIDVVESPSVVTAPQQEKGFWATIYRALFVW